MKRHHLLRALEFALYLALFLCSFAYSVQRAPPTRFIYTNF